MNCQRLKSTVVMILMVGLAAAAPTHAQSSAAAEVRLHSNLVTWSVTQTGQVRAELLEADAVIGWGEVDAAAPGVVHIPLFVGGLPSGRPAVIRPGHRLVLTGPDGSLEIPAVPLLATDIDPVRHVAMLVSPPGAAHLVLRREDGTVAVDRNVVVGAAPISVDLSDTTVRPGDRGTMTWQDTDPATFVLPVGVFAATVRWDLNRVEGVDTAGNVLGIGVDDDAGRTKGGAQVEVLNEPSWAAGLALASPLATGDRVTLRRGDRLVPGAPGEVAVTLPPLSLEVDLSARQVRGTGPAGATLDLALRLPDGATVARPVQVDAAGRFAVTLAGGQLVPGTWVALDYRTTDEVTIRREGVAARLRVALDTVQARVEGNPGAVARVTLHHAGDGRDYDATREVDRSGQALLELPVDIEAGDTVRYSLDDGPAGQLVVPALTARADVGAQVIAGEAPAGSAVEVMSFGFGLPTAPVEAIADGTGHFSVTVPPAWGLVPGHNGLASVTVSGAQVARIWGAVQLEIDIGSQYVAGNPGGGREVALQVFDTAGLPKATGQVTISEGLLPFNNSAGQWGAALRGPDALPVPLAVGDRLVVDAGGTRAELVVPAVDIELDPPGDRVAGRTLPGAAVDIDVQRLVAGKRVARASWSGAAGPDGRFEHTFQDYDLRAGDTATGIVTTGEGHRIRRERTADWIYLRLDNGVVAGGVAPVVAIDASLIRDGTPIGHAAGTSDRRGTFSLRLQNEGGSRVLPQPGDVVTVDYPGRPPDDLLRIDVHAVSLEWDLGHDTVFGTALPGADVAMAFEKVEIGWLGSGTMATVAGADGRWSVDLFARTNIHLTPGMRLESVEILPSGHRIGRQRYIPLLDLQLDGPRISGRGDPLAKVEFALVNGSGSTLGQARGTSDDDGRFELALADTAGGPVRLDAGHQISVAIGAHARVVSVPPLDVRVTWAPKTLIEVQTTPGYPVDFWVRPGCRPGDGDDRQPGMMLRMDPSGHYNQVGRSAATPGTRTEFGVTPEPGWRFYRLPTRPLVLLELGEAQVSGCAPPLTAVAIALRDQAGVHRGQGAATADADGEYRLRLDDPAGQPVAVAEGDVATLTASGDKATVVAEALWLHRKPNGTLMGGGAPNRDLALLFQLPGGRRECQWRRTGSEGEFGYSVADLPLEADWSPVLAERVWAYMATANDHFVGIAAVPAPPSPVLPRPLYLPLCRLHR
jgi:hypothetical protein